MARNSIGRAHTSAAEVPYSTPPAGELRQGTGGAPDGNQASPLELFVFAGMVMALDEEPSLWLTLTPHCRHCLPLGQ